MRLIVHMGFHKTASSYLQSLLNRNHEALAERGIWYEPQPVTHAAHHRIADPLLIGDAAPFRDMIASARAESARTVIFSSENLEGVVFNPQIAALLEQAAAEEGVDEIEWHAAIREPGAYFASIHSQLSWHTYADSLTLFTEAMKKGVIFLPEPHAGEDATPYWFFCFDYFAFLSGFAAVPGRRVIVHDYADRAPYPGWRMIDALGAMDALVDQPNEAESNHRLPNELAADFFRARLKDAAGDAATWAAIKDAAEANLAANLATVPVYADAVGKRYAESYAQALRVFGATAARVAA